MDFSISTHWNAARHSTGEDLAREIIALGCNRLELGYDCICDLVPGIKRLVAEGAIAVDSLHAYCPLPLGATSAHPEIYTLAHPDARNREMAVKYTVETLRFAAEIGARAVVIHAGNIDMPAISRELISLARDGDRASSRYEKLFVKAQVLREAHAPSQRDHLYRSVEALLPALNETKVTLAFENLPTWEAIPTEIEVEKLLDTFDTPRLGYWHDVGHAAIRESLGFINHRRWLERLAPRLVGMHLHDQIPPRDDHVMPPRGTFNFSLLTPFINRHIIRVLEPGPGTPAEEVAEGLRFLKALWNAPENKSSTN